MAQLVFLLILFMLMWVFVVRPQQQRVRRHRELVDSIQVGDEVVAAGGIVGVVVGMDSDHVSLEVAPGTVMKVVRLAVNSRTGPDPLDPDDVPLLGEADDLDASEPADGVDLEERGGPDQKGARGEDGA